MSEQNVNGQTVHEETTTEETSQGRRTWIEEIEVAAEDLVEAVKELVKEGNANRIMVLKPNDEVLINIPLPVGAVIGGIAVLAQPLITALVALAAMMGNYKLRVVRPVADEPVDEVKEQ